MTPPSRATIGGRVYLDLQRYARAQHRPFEELLQLYTLEAFLDRLSRSAHVDALVLKGGVLLAAFGQRRPTRDVDLQAQEMSNDAEAVRASIVEIAALPLEDGIVFDTADATAEVIRDEDAYNGVRVSMGAALATARQRFHVDVNVGDPITPPPELVRLPRLLGGEIAARAYPLAMVLAEKLVTAVARGTANTRWRDFVDVYGLCRHPIDGAELRSSVLKVAKHRGVELQPLAEVLDGYGDIAQQRWVAWRRKQQLEGRVPESFERLVTAVTAFADPIITATVEQGTWDPSTGTWS